MLTLCVFLKANPSTCIKWAGIPVVKLQNGKRMGTKNLRKSIPFLFIKYTSWITTFSCVACHQDTAWLGIGVRTGSTILKHQVFGCFWHPNARFSRIKTLFFFHRPALSAPGRMVSIRWVGTPMMKCFSRGSSRIAVTGKSRVRWKDLFFVLVLLFIRFFGGVEVFGLSMIFFLGTGFSLGMSQVEPSSLRLSILKS